MNKAMLALLPLALVILVSGCTAPGFTTAGGAGVVIEAFDPDFSQIYSTEKVQLQLQVRNTGSVDANVVEANVLGIDKTLWTLVSSESTCSEGTIAEELLAPDPARGTGGGQKSCIFTYEVPKNIPEGLSMTFNPTVRVGYEYDSQIVKSLTLLSGEEARRLQQQGSAFPAETVSSSTGPISLDITTKGPIRMFTNSVEFPLEINIRNVGGGVVGHLDRETSNWNKLELAIILPSNLKSNDCNDVKTISLFKGQSNTITCNVEATEIPSQPIQVQIRASAVYYYFTEKTTSVQVTGV